MLIPSDVELRSLHCEEADYATFEPNDGFDSFPSLVNLTLQGGDLTALVEANFLTPAVLPSLRLFYASEVYASEVRLDDGLVPLSLTYPSTRYAAALHHLSLTFADDDVLPLLLSTHHLRSLDLSFFESLVFPSNFRFAIPLIAFRLNMVFGRDALGFILGELETMLAVELIDTKTVVILPGLAESDAAGIALKAWCQSRGIRLEWSDGELERGWCEVDSGYRVHREFARWVDGIAEERRIGQ